MCLRHGRFGSVDYIVHKHFSEWELYISTVNVLCFLVIGIVEMVATVIAGNVYIFPYFNESIGSEDS